MHDSNFKTDSSCKIADVFAKARMIQIYFSTYLVWCAFHDLGDAEHRLCSSAEYMDDEALELHIDRLELSINVVSARFLCYDRVLNQPLRLKPGLSRNNNAPSLSSIIVEH